MQENQNQPNQPPQKPTEDSEPESTENQSSAAKPPIQEKAADNADITTVDDIEELDEMDDIDDIDDFDEDIDDIDDFEEAEWDDFDDEDPEDLSSDQEENTQNKKKQKTKTSSSSENKTFLQKHFNIIVITVVMGLGIGWFLLSSPSQNTNNNDNKAAEKTLESENPAQALQNAKEEPIGFLSNPDLLKNFEGSLDKDLPMPTPIAPAEEENVLTPLPGQNTAQTEQEAPTLMASLQEPLTSADRLKLDKGKTKGNEDQSSESQKDNVSVSLQEQVNLEAQIEKSPEEDKSIFQSQEKTAPAHPAEPVSQQEIGTTPQITKDTHKNMGLAEQSENVQNTQNSSDTLAELKEEQVKNVALTTDINNLQEQIGNLNSQLKSSKDTAANAQTQLKQKDNAIKSLNGDIAALKAEIASLQKTLKKQDKELEQFSKKAQAAPPQEQKPKNVVSKDASSITAQNQSGQIKAPSPTPTIKPKTATQSVPSTLYTQQKTEQNRNKRSSNAAHSASSKASTGAIKWILRSAQPGRAIVSAQNSHDVRTIAVGEKLEGIGVIQSIDIQNGRWVVSGTTGNITQ